MLLSSYITGFTEHKPYSKCAHTHLVHCGVVRPGLAVKFIVSRSLFLIYFPVIGPHLSRGYGFSWWPGWSRGGLGLDETSRLAAVIDSLEVEGVRSGCLVLKDHLEETE